MAGGSSVELRLHSITQGDVFATFHYDPATPTRKWHEALVQFAKEQWERAGKTGTTQSFPYIGKRWTKGEIPPALWTSASFKEGDIIPNGTKDMKPTVREASGAIKVPPSVDALLNHYFGPAERLVIFTFVP
jgi:hypothetical protein